MMLRVTIQATSHRTTLKIEGELTSPRVQTLERLWERVREHSLHDALGVDVTSVSSLDAAGERILRQMHKDGATVTTDGFQAPLTEEVVDPRTTLQKRTRRKNMTVRRKRVDRDLYQSRS
jgi:ABC-type transporter Mla MlaB component